MKTLTIKDLARTEQLDRTAMAAVRGGMKMGSPSYSYGDFTFAPSYDDSIHAVQNLGSQQTVFNPTANGSAFIGPHVSVDNDTSQASGNTIVG